ncbi:DNA replication protein DnaC [Acidipila rosea]|uniref:DNA replication protein DnaC n=2 Tax=Acidipila rosea TaxID=768535 RepID=A0A4R1LA33_9BACT|nr:DNA replication protein DnaC [Acidipila rosea]
MGMQVLVLPDGTRKAEVCDCRHQLRVNRLIERARIPKRYEHCTLENYSYQGRDQSLFLAWKAADKFLDGYPALTKESGLLFTGSIGIGKTHLATGILKALIMEKGVHGLFCDYRELLKQVQNSYNPQVAATELEVLAPVFEAEVLVIDELGAAKPTDWVWDTVAHILNTRYNDKRTTIITTNYADERPGAGAAKREETLGDRIGERMRSRLAEMCVTVEMQGEDYRRTAGRARFA